MGVRGLLGWIQCLLRGLPAVTPDWAAYKGKKIGIDILGFLYRAKSRRQSTVLYIARLIAAFRRCGMIPVPVFDGRPPPEKQSLLDSRRYTENHLQHEDDATTLQTQSLSLSQSTTCFTGEEREFIKQLLYVCGVAPLNASGEADNVLAYLAKTGEIAAVISHDMDLLVRGVETLWVPDSYALPGDRGGWATYSCSNLCERASLSYIEFVTMSVLMGCDYTHGLLRLHYRAAYALVKSGLSLETLLEQKGCADPSPYQTAIAFFEGRLDTHDSLMNERQWIKLHSLIEEPEWATLYSLRETLLRSLSASEFRDLCLSETLLAPLASSATSSKMYRRTTETESRTEWPIKECREICDR
jgi:5'-3' exonuclease